MAKKYIVKKGDNLWRIAKDNNISLDELIKLNSTKKNIIYPNDELRLEPDKITERVNLREERLAEDRFNLADITAIQGYKHNDNYVIIDKKNRKFNVYDKDNNLLYTTSDISTGLSGDDYNTITYVNKNGKIVNNAGNNSTPAGISEITGKGIYHGHPSFTRGRVGSDGAIRKVKNAQGDIVDDNIASSLHWGNTNGNRLASNGCVRISGKSLTEIEPYLSTGTRVYTLPEKEGSRFTLKAGKLNFVAENPNGETEGDKKYWDDYNTTIDKSYNPLVIKFKNTGNKEYDTNRKQYAQSLVDNKKRIQQQFGLTSDEYNRLVDLALGIAEQESKFGTSTGYKLKEYAGDIGVSIGKGAKKNMSSTGGKIAHALSLANSFISLPVLVNDYITGNKMAQSRGITQIKMSGDNKELNRIYSDLGINKDNITNINKAALATITKLAYTYNNEIKGKNFTSADGNAIDPYHALLYKYSGKNKELKNKTATPHKNIYIRNVNDYSRAFDLYEDRVRTQYELGGKLNLEDI